MFYTVCALFIAFNQGAIGYLDGDFWSAIFTAERSGVSVERRTGAQKKLRSGEYLKALRCVQDERRCRTGRITSIQFEFGSCAVKT